MAGLRYRGLLLGNATFPRDPHGLAELEAALTDTSTSEGEISGEAAVDTAAAALVTRYGIPAERARADVAVLVDQLRDHGLLIR